MSFTLKQLTENIHKRNMGSQNSRLIDKWSRTGLLRGLNGIKRESMARLLENQAAQVLKEASAVSTGAGNLTQSGDLRGFTNIAFPLVRRVFGGLIANDLVSVQPMSLPSGLLFYLDYTRGGDNGASAGDVAGSGNVERANEASIYTSGSSLYNSPAGKVQVGSDGVGGLYDLAGQGYSRVFKETRLTTAMVARWGAHKPDDTISQHAGTPYHTALSATGSDARAVQFDPQIIRTIEANSVQGSSSGSHPYSLLAVRTSTLTNFDSTMVKEVGLAALSGSLGIGEGTGGVDKMPTDLPNELKVVTTDSLGNPIQEGRGLCNVKRLNQLGTVADAANGVGKFTVNPFADVTDANTAILMVCKGALIYPAQLSNSGSVIYPVASKLHQAGTGDTLAIPAFESDFSADGSPVIPEIDIKVESIPVVAETRKLRAKWSPELAQDLNAYHSLDAEVELTQILSEEIALEIDREILNDLLTQAKAANYHWSRAPGTFVDKTTGLADAGPSFTGTVREWYETLVETIIDVANQIHRKTLRGSANFIVVGPDVATILEASVFYKPSYSIDGDGQVSQPMTIGADATGTLSNRFTVYKDPYFPRNKVLVGFKGGSYLETGYVYAPYVPLIVTPTIFQPEDFTPRKGVMTRYGKKMVRADFYGTVTIQKMNII